jgi:hypothetical protein
MRTAFTIVFALTFLVGSGRQQTATAIVKAWSTTNGADGQVWHLSIGRNDPATVSTSSELGARSAEREFRISAAQRQKILHAPTTRSFSRWRNIWVRVRFRFMGRRTPWSSKSVAVSTGSS